MTLIPLISQIRTQIKTQISSDYADCADKIADWRGFHRLRRFFNLRNQRNLRQSVIPAMGEEYKHKELTGKIIGCAMQVHSFLGNGFQEVIYQRALALEFKKAGIAFERELSMPIYYRDHPEPIGTRRVDFLVEGKVLVELKATTQITEVHWAQIINYLTAYKLEVGLLINFGEKSLAFQYFGQFLRVETPYFQGILERI